MALVKTYGITRYLPVTKPTGVAADPLCVFHFRPQDDYLSDRTGNGRDLSVVTGAFDFSRDPETGLWGLQFDAGDHELILPDEEVTRVAQNELGTDDASLTLEAIVRQDQDNSGYIFGCDASGESLTTNYLWQFGTVWNDGGTRKYYSFTERGSGSNNEVFSNAPAVYARLIYLALTISSDGLTWTYYVNGLPIGGYTLANPAQKNSAGGNAQRVRIGRAQDDAADFKGLMCSLRMTAETFDPADITETWEALQGTDSFARKSVGGYVEVVADPVDLGGPKTDGYLGHGLLIPGPPSQTLGTVGPLDSGAVEIEALGEVADRYSPTRKLLPDESTRSVQLEIETAYWLGIATDYRKTTNDFNGHPHFISDRILYAFFYDAAKEAGLWTTPTDPSFTGYGKDGRYYVNGVDQGSFAPWHDETESDDRGPRQDFPDKVLVCVGFNDLALTPSEVVIFDLDNFPTEPPAMWMRFKFGDSGGQYSMMGRVNQKPTAVSMANGIMTVVTKEGDYRGGIHLVNFTAIGQDCAHLIRSDTHYKWSPANEIVDRNLKAAAYWTTSGVSPSLRIDEESLYEVVMLANGGTTWLVVGGEDPGPNMFRVQTNPNLRIRCSGELGDANIGDKRKLAFDEDESLWVVLGARLHRVLKVDWEQEHIYIYTSLANFRPGAARSWIELPYEINDLVAVGDYIFASTDAGVYRIHRGSMDYALAYTISGGGGGGTNDAPPAGELLPGDEPEVYQITGYALHSAHYLAMTTKRGVAIVRTLDDVAVDSRLYPELHEPGAHFNVPMVK